MLEDILSFMRQRLFGRTQCKPAETQSPEEKESKTAGIHGELQSGLQGTSTHSSESTEESRGLVTPPKKTTVLIMVDPPTDHQQVGSE